MNQLVANVVIGACLYSLVGTAFGLSERLTRFFNMAYGAVYMGAAYITYVMFLCHVPLLVSTVIGLGFSTAVACGIELSLFRQLYASRASPLILFLVSLSAWGLLQSCVTLLFGSQPKALWNAATAHVTSIGSVHVTLPHILLVLVCSLQSMFVGVALRWTEIGLEIRAISSNESLAVIAGARVGHIRLITVAFSSLLFASAGILAALDGDLTPYMGGNVILMGMTIAVLAGDRIVIGTIVSAAILACVQNVSALFISAGWQEPVGFTLLIGILVLRSARPTGVTRA